MLDGMSGDTREAGGDVAKGRVLIVEDEYVISLLTEQQLVESGFTVTGVAGGAEEAIALAERTRPDLVLMDIRLGVGPDGIHAAREIRARFGIPSVFATAQADSFTRNRAEAEACPIGWLFKPYRLGQLVDAVSSGLRCVRTARHPPQDERGS